MKPQASIHGARFAQQTARIHFLKMHPQNSHFLRHSEHRTASPVPLGEFAKNLLLYRGFTLGALTEHCPRLAFVGCTLKAPKTILRFKSDPSHPYRAARLKPCGAQDDGLITILHKEKVETLSSSAYLPLFLFTVTYDCELSVTENLLTSCSCGVCTHRVSTPPCQ